MWLSCPGRRLRTVPLPRSASFTEMHVGSPGSDSASPSVVSTHLGLRSASSVAGGEELLPRDHRQGAGCTWWVSRRAANAFLVRTTAGCPHAERSFCSLAGLPHSVVHQLLSALPGRRPCCFREKSLSLAFCLLSLRLSLDLRHRLASAVGMDSLPFPECLSCLVAHCDHGEVPLNPSWLRALILNALEFYVDFYLLGCFCKPWGKRLVS